MKDKNINLKKTSAISGDLTPQMQDIRVPSSNFDTLRKIQGIPYDNNMNKVRQNVKIGDRKKISTKNCR